MMEELQDTWKMAEREDMRPRLQRQKRTTTSLNHLFYSNSQTHSQAVSAL